ncbi:MAG: stage V sporulation protein S [Trueperaceae bacterium]|nr:stage V sporulation protein S [Trueperaceae bacterium]
METLRVSATSRPHAVAGAIAGVLRRDRTVAVQAIGASAVNQAIKALAVARGYLADDRLELAATPGFVTLELHGEERTAVHLHVAARPNGVEATGTPPEARRAPIVRWADALLD